MSIHKTRTLTIGLRVTGCVLVSYVTIESERSAETLAMILFVFLKDLPIPWSHCVLPWQGHPMHRHAADVNLSNCVHFSDPFSRLSLADDHVAFPVNRCNVTDSAAGRDSRPDSGS